MTSDATTSGPGGARDRGDAAAHWDDVYGCKGAEAVSWFRPRLETSLELIAAAGISPDTPVVDVGGGASTLVDDLLARGFRSITVLDVSATALELARRRLGSRSDRVRWIHEDVTGWEPEPGGYGLWHDRAVFHFLVEPGRRQRYVEGLRRGLAPGGHVVLATFGPEGPRRCSGLPVRRYRPEDLESELGPAFTLEASRTEEHATPSGSIQQFTYALLRRAGQGPDG